MKEAAQLLSLPFCEDRLRAVLGLLFPSWREECEGERIGWLAEGIEVRMMQAGEWPRDAGGNEAIWAQADKALRHAGEGWLVAIEGKDEWRLSWIRRSHGARRGRLRWTSLPVGKGGEVELPGKGRFVFERLERWFDHRRWRKRALELSLSELMARIESGAAGTVRDEPDGLEEWMALDPSMPGDLLEQMGGRVKRRGAGVYYTPPQLAAELSRKAVADFLKSHEQSELSLAKVRVLEMATGAGGLLIAMVREIARARKILASARGEALDFEDLKREVVLHAVHGVDLDPLALKVANWRLRLYSGAEGQLWEGDFMKKGPWVKMEYDWIIGNPPWGVEREARHRAALKRRYPQLPVLAPDRALGFVCRSMEILRPGGALAVILPNAWLTTRSAEIFRRWLLDRNVRLLEEYGDGVFAGAVVECLLMLVRKQAAEDSAQRTLWLADKGATIRLRSNVEKAALLARLRAAHVPFRSLAVIRWGIKPYQVGRGIPPQTKEIVKTRPFHSDQPLGEEWKPLIVGGDVDRYSVSFSGCRYLHYGPWLMYPSDERLMVGPKLLLRQTSDSLRCAYDESGLYAQNSLFVIGSEQVSLYYLLALLNSRLLGTLYSELNPQQGKVFAEIKPSVIAELPIARGSVEEEETLVTLAREVMERGGVGTEALEGEIDRRVEALYGVMI